MPRRPRGATGQFTFHVINRAVEGLVLFEDSEDFRCFLSILVAGMKLFPVRMLAYCLMPNHWHLVVWPCTDEALSGFMKWVTGTHAQALRRARQSVGRGSVYQGRYKAIAVQDDRHLIRLCHYVERNALRAKLVARAENWPWSSASPRATDRERPVISDWPVPRPANWLERLNAPESPRALKQVRAAVRTSRHFGSLAWRRRCAEALGWREGHRGQGRTWQPTPVVDATAARHPGR